MLHAPSETVDGAPLCGEPLTAEDAVCHHGPVLDKVDCPQCRKRMGLPPIRHLRSVD